MITSILAFVIMASALLFGAVEIWSSAAVLTLVYTLGLVWVLKREYAAYRAPLHTKLLIVTGFAFLLYTVLQTIPLPLVILQYLSPGSYRLREFYALGPAGPGTISLIPYRSLLEVLKVAVAGSPASEPVPSIAAPFLNVTVPVGALAASLSLTVAVNVTDWPKTEGFREDITVVVVPGMNSYAPISQCVPCGRVTPRWSTPFTGHAAQIESSPPFIAGLPATSAIVCVGPPLP